MKNIIFILIFIGGVFTSYSQVTLSIDEYNGLRTEIDSLQKGLKQVSIENVNLKKESSKQSDSLRNLFHKLEKENNTLIKEKGTLSTELALQKKEVGDFNKNSRENLATIEILQTKLNKLNEEYAAFKKQSLISEQKQFERGKQEVLSTVTNSYGKLSFDEMIKASSEGQVKRDLKLVVDKELKKKLEDLDVYFSAKKVLGSKFDKQIVQASLHKAQTINDKSSLVNLLIDNLSNYKLRNDALKDVIQKIQDVDNRFIANTDKDQTEKEVLILSEISWYFYNYDYNFEDYPYLSSIIMEIMKTKHKDANIDTTYILDKL